MVAVAPSILRYAHVINNNNESAPKRSSRVQFALHSRCHKVASRRSKKAARTSAVSLETHKSRKKLRRRATPPQKQQRKSAPSNLSIPTVPDLARDVWTLKEYVRLGSAVEEKAEDEEEEDDEAQKAAARRLYVETGTRPSFVTAPAGISESAAKRKAKKKPNQIVVRERSLRETPMHALSELCEAVKDATHPRNASRVPRIAAVEEMHKAMHERSHRTLVRFIASKTEKMRTNKKDEAKGKDKRTYHSNRMRAQFVSKLEKVASKKRQSLAPSRYQRTVYDQIRPRVFDAKEFAKINTDLIEGKLAALGLFRDSIAKVQESVLMRDSFAAREVFSELLDIQRHDFESEDADVGSSMGSSRSISGERIHNLVNAEIERLKRSMANGEGESDADGRLAGFECTPEEDALFVDAIVSDSEVNTRLGRAVKFSLDRAEATITSALMNIRTRSHEEAQELLARARNSTGVAVPGVSKSDAASEKSTVIDESKQKRNTVTASPLDIVPHSWDAIHEDAEGEAADQARDNDDEDSEFWGLPFYARKRLVETAYAGVRDAGLRVGFAGFDQASASELTTIMFLSEFLIGEASNIAMPPGDVCDLVSSEAKRPGNDNNNEAVIGATGVCLDLVVSKDAINGDGPRVQNIAGVLAFNRGFDVFMASREGDSEWTSVGLDGLKQKRVTRKSRVGKSAWDTTIGNLRALLVGCEPEFCAEFGLVFDAPTAAISFKSPQVGTLMCRQFRLKIERAFGRTEDELEAALRVLTRAVLDGDTLMFCAVDFSKLRSPALFFLSFVVLALRFHYPNVLLPSLIMTGDRSGCRGLFKDLFRTFADPSTTDCDHSMAITYETTAETSLEAMRSISWAHREKLVNSDSEKARTLAEAEALAEAYDEKISEAVRESRLEMCNLLDERTRLIACIRELRKSVSASSDKRASVTFRQTIGAKSMELPPSHEIVIGVSNRLAKRVKAIQSESQSVRKKVERMIQEVNESERPKIVRTFQTAIGQHHGMLGDHPDPRARDLVLVGVRTMSVVDSESPIHLSRAIEVMKLARKHCVPSDLPPPLPSAARMWGQRQADPSGCVFTMPRFSKEASDNSAACLRTRTQEEAIAHLKLELNGIPDPKRFPRVTKALAHEAADREINRRARAERERHVLDREDKLKEFDQREEFARTSAVRTIKSLVNLHDRGLDLFFHSTSDRVTQQPASSRSWAAITALNPNVDWANARAPRQKEKK